MSLVRAVKPQFEPVSLEQVRRHLRIEHNDDDADLAMYIAAARQKIEGPAGHLNRALVTQTWDLKLDGVPDDRSVLLPLPPLQSVTSITYATGAATTATFASSGYFVFGAGSNTPGGVQLAADASWPDVYDKPESFVIRFVCGWAGSGTSEADVTANVPADIKHAILLMVGHLYENREAIRTGSIAVELPKGYDHLLAGYDMIGL